MATEHKPSFLKHHTTYLSYTTLNCQGQYTSSMQCAIGLAFQLHLQIEFLLLQAISCHQ